VARPHNVCVLLEDQMIRRMGYPPEPTRLWQRRPSPVFFKPLYVKGNIPSELLGRTPRDIKRTATVVAGRGCVRTGRGCRLKDRNGRRIWRRKLISSWPSNVCSLSDIICGIPFTHLIGLAGNQICHLDPAGEGR
jgi:hypothetical protein